MFTFIIRRKKPNLSKNERFGLAGNGEIFSRCPVRVVQSRGLWSCPDRVRAWARVFSGFPAAPFAIVRGRLRARWQGSFPSLWSVFPSPSAHDVQAFSTCLRPRRFDRECYLARGRSTRRLLPRFDNGSRFPISFCNLGAGIPKKVAAELGSTVESDTQSGLG